MGTGILLLPSLKSSHQIWHNLLRTCPNCLEYLYQYYCHLKVNRPSCSRAFNLVYNVNCYFLFLTQSLVDYGKTNENIRFYATLCNRSDFSFLTRLSNPRLFATGYYYICHQNQHYHGFGFSG